MSAGMIMELEPQISLPMFPSSAGGELFVWILFSLHGNMDAQSGMKCLVCSVSYLQSWSSLVTIQWMNAHMVESVYTPVPKRRVKAQTPPARACQPGQLPSQHQRPEGPALGRCSDTGDPWEVWHGKAVGKTRQMTCDPCHSVPVLWLYVPGQLWILLLDSLDCLKNKHT